MRACNRTKNHVRETERTWDDYWESPNEAIGIRTISSFPFIGNHVIINTLTFTRPDTNKTICFRKNFKNWIGEEGFTWVASQIVLKLMKWSLTFSTPYFCIMVFSTNFPAKGKNISYSSYILQTRRKRCCVWLLTNILCFSLQHSSLICNTKFYKILVWIKPLRYRKFKFLQQNISLEVRELVHIKIKSKIVNILP